jgi:hypothetical protein
MVAIFPVGEGSIVRGTTLFVTGSTLMVLSTAVVVTTGAAAIVLTILAAIFAPVFSAVLTTRGLIGLTRHRGGGQQRARDEKCTEQL